MIGDTGTRWRWHWDRRAYIVHYMCIKATNGNNDEIRLPSRVPSRRTGSKLWQSVFQKDVTGELKGAMFDMETLHLS
jgi:hypothetical protein